MKKWISGSFALTLLFANVNAQKHTYIGVEGALTNDVYEVIDKGPQLKNIPLLTSYFGLNIRQDLSTTVFAETGLLRKFYDEGIGFKAFPGYTSGNAINAWLIPFRLGTRINLHKRKTYLVPIIGYTLGINSDYGYGDGGIGGHEINSKDTIHHTDHSKLSLRRTFPLLQTGIGVEWMLFRNAVLSLSANYYTGFTNVIEQDISYTHNSTSYTATGLSKGEIMSFGMAVRYPVSKLWSSNKDKHHR